LILVFVHEFGVLTVQHFPLFSLLEIHEGVGFLLGLALHEEHSSLISFFDLLGELFLLNSLLVCLLLLFLLVLVEGLSLGFSNPLLLPFFVLALLSSLLFLLFCQLFPVCHNHAFLVVD
jgi:hypothetical protein